MQSLMSFAGAISRRRWSGVLLAIVAVAGAVVFRSLLEGLGQFYYLPMVPAVVITAMLARRSATALAVALSIAVNLALVPRESLSDALTNAALFAGVTWILAELCWGLRALDDRTRDLTRRLAAKEAMLNTALASVPVVTLEADGAIRRLNPAAATYLHASQVDMEKAGALGDSALRTVELAKGQLLRAGKIIRRMRELLSPEARRLDSERASSMVEDLGPILTMIGSSKGVAIRMEIDAANDRVQAERIQFQQAMVNLVRNAVEAVGDQAAPEVVIVGRPA